MLMLCLELVETVDSRLKMESDGETWRRVFVATVGR